MNEYDKSLRGGLATRMTDCLIALRVQKSLDLKYGTSTCENNVGVALINRWHRDINLQTRVLATARNKQSPSSKSERAFRQMVLFGTFRSNIIFQARDFVRLSVSVFEKSG
ncbi:hypothetical protein NPIL_250001 [Nephila pilipes]|uniref:Uncharacterized protein n=1 Tax=Nephila pilipes TaxID=299642 RepID=A0A8X6ITB7_NEPPI|nr:hypothetical protein NPIL_250001 [Nephila pilipes]